MIFRTFSKKLNRDVWAIDVRVAGVRIREATFASKRDAQDAIAAMRLRYRNQRLGLEEEETSIITLGDLLEARRRDPSRQANRGRRRLLAWFELFVEEDPYLPIRNISTSRLHAFQQKLIALGLKPASVNFAMAGVTASLNAGRLYFGELENFAAPRLSKMSAEGREVVVPRSVLRSVVDEMRLRDQNDRADIFELLILTGCRSSEILAADPSWIDPETRVLTLPARITKTRKQRRIPLCGRSEAILANWVKPDCQYRSFRETVATAAQARGIPVSDDTWLIHDIRHTAATVLARGRINLAIIAALLGHRLGGMTVKYTHADDHALRDAVNVLDGYWSEKVVSFPALREA